MTNKKAIERIKWEFDNDIFIRTPHRQELFDALTMAIQALSQEPTIQDKQAESEKYQKAFDNGYANGYAQAMFDYEQQPCDTSMEQALLLEVIDKFLPIECRDTISRDVMLDAIKRISLGQTDVVKVSMMLEEYVKKLPSVTPSRPKGHWVHKGQGIYCSECGKESGYNPFGASRFSDYCPNCGVEMKGEK